MRWSTSGAVASAGPLIITVDLTVVTRVSKSNSASVPVLCLCITRQERGSVSTGSGSHDAEAMQHGQAGFFSSLAASSAAFSFAF